MPRPPLRSLLVALLLPTCASASTLWSTGPSDLTFSLPPGADTTLPQNQDQITPLDFLTRNSFQGLFNAASESAFTHAFSPADTKWAFSGLNGNPAFSYGSGAAIASSLTFLPWDQSLGGGGSLQFNITSHPGVLHLLAYDIYLDINFSDWQASGSGSFTYTHATGTLPTTWSSPTGNWSNPANWSPLAAFPSNTPSFHFAPTISSGTPQLDVNATITSLTLAGASNAWTSALDLTTHTLILQPDPASKPAALATLTNQLTFGRSHNAGIIDSTLPPNLGIALLDNALTNFTSFANQPVDQNSLILTPLLLGDTNADGTINATDLNTLLQNFGKPSPNWTDGNFHNLPSINLTDLADVLNNFNISYSLPAIPTPEPATLTLSLLSVPALLRRKCASK